MKNAVAAIIFPHQLFRDNPVVSQADQVILLEEHLFFRQFRFHKQKLIFHRASMRAYMKDVNRRLSGKKKISYIESPDPLSDIRKLIPSLYSEGTREICCIDPVDDYLSRRIRKACQECGVELRVEESPMFINTTGDIFDYFSGKKRLRQTDFYIKQRKNHAYLVNSQGEPEGGQWTFDTQNREKFPPGEKSPPIPFPEDSEVYKEARKYVNEQFPDNYGRPDPGVRYPVTFSETSSWLEQFLEERFSEFGRYQDAMVQSGSNLNHSLLSPMLNVGLITPGELLNRLVEHGKSHHIPFNSLEGFVRQVLGWREFLRGVYQSRGGYQRTNNYWGFQRKIPASFWEGTTGIAPVDLVIGKVLNTGYAHHIERLMVLGNFMLLCEFDPDEVYRWFMELFMDAYDWVMVPNVYGMSQYADGGLMSTKPYISSSNYLRKMSDFQPGPWQEIWDALFWRFMDVHREELSGNPRLRMLISSFDKMDPEKRTTHLERAGTFLEKL